MKKCTFYRTMYKAGGGCQTVKTDGYCETLTDKDENEITLCFHKDSDYSWIVTEKSTGFKVCEGSKRTEALKEAKKYLDRIYEKIRQLEEYKDLVAKAYAEEIR